MLFRSASWDLWLKGDTARALETVAAALASNPLDSIPPRQRPYYALATFYALAGSPDRARELLAEWEEAAVPPDSLIAQDRVAREAVRRRMQGVVALAEGRPEDAVAEFRFVTQRDPRSLRGLSWLGRALELAGDKLFVEKAPIRYESHHTDSESLNSVYTDNPWMCLAQHVVIRHRNREFASCFDRCLRTLEIGRAHV